jgi:hypothetical protein
VLRAADGERDVVNGGPGRDRAQADARFDDVMQVERRAGSVCIDACRRSSYR